MTIEEKISQHLKAYRAKSGKTQKEMAAHIGVSYAIYQEMETDGIVKKLDGLKKLKDKTGFNTQENMYETDKQDYRDKYIAVLEEKVQRLEKKIQDLEAAQYGQQSSQ